MKNILLLVHQDAGEEARLKVAIDLTRALSGHLICIDITPFPIVFDQGMSLAPAFILDEAKREEVNKADLQRRIESEKISWNWDDITDDFVPALIEVATRADIVVLNRKLDTTARPNMRSITSSVLMHTNALVVAVGEHSRGIQLDCPALVAWDGSAQASLALERALPLLKKASLVTIFQLGDLPEESVTAKEAAEYLSRQKVASQIEIAPASNEIAAEICLAATRVGATYCVMGAFGHSRLREALFGGVTRAMLDMATLPLALAH
ncbi:universal stress protein [Novosphingobium sp. G106]|uniref:universal stress protein n=1 Tax=Novosphingobium sp. G106 TaxID=2849500 RepID=UPI001C2DE02C|nr:universal stress protein [Novosphingobium sp. G106]MBV1691921.1 universal stress protein [Novosphingobium sp. G106]